MIRRSNSTSRSGLKPMNVKLHPDLMRELAGTLVFMRSEKNNEPENGMKKLKTALVNKYCMSSTFLPLKNINLYLSRNCAMIFMNGPNHWMRQIKLDYRTLHFILDLKVIQSINFIELGHTYWFKDGPNDRITTDVMFTPVLRRIKEDPSIKSLNEFIFQGDLINFKDYPNYRKTIASLLEKFSSSIQKITIPEEFISYIPTKLYPHRVYYPASDTNWPYRPYPAKIKNLKTRFLRIRGSVCNKLLKILCEVQAETIRFDMSSFHENLTSTVQRTDNHLKHFQCCYEPSVISAPPETSLGQFTSIVWPINAMMMKKMPNLKSFEVEATFRSMIQFDQLKTVSYIYAALSEVIDSLSHISLDYHILVKFFMRIDVRNLVRYHNSIRTLFTNLNVQIPHVNTLLWSYSSLNCKQRSKDLTLKYGISTCDSLQNILANNRVCILTSLYRRDNKYLRVCLVFYGFTTDKEARDHTELGLRQKLMDEIDSRMGIEI